MTPDAFLDALAKGLGRTVLALQEGDPAPYADAILAACVENLKYPAYFQADRAPYLMRLIELAGLEERALETVLESLPRAEREKDRDQMVDLLAIYAGRGEGRAWDALVRCGREGDAWAWTQLAHLGPRGLEWVAEHVLPGLPTEERYRISSWLPDEKADDATPLQRRLRTMYEEWIEEAKGEGKRSEWGKVPTREFLRRLDDPEGPPITSIEFGRRASRREMRQAAERFLTETDRRALRKLKWLFQEFDYPLPLGRLIRHATDPERGMAIRAVLGRTDSPAVRHFALRLLRRRPLPWGAIEALCWSFQYGDEAAILSALPGVAGDDPHRRHDVALDLTKLLKRWPQGRWRPHAEWVYEHSPCSRCRTSAVDWMVERGALPEAIREEAAYDAEPDIREAAETGTRSV